MSLNLDKSTWKRVAFGDVVKNHNDYYDPSTDGVMPYVAGPHIDPGEASVLRYGSTDDDEFPPTFKRLFQAGDVLLHSRGIEKLGVVDRAGVTGEKLFVLRTIDPHVLDQRFLPWLLISPPARAYFGANFSGSVNKFLNWGPLRAMEFALPPPDEQKRLADLLWAVEHHRAAISSAAAFGRAAERRWLGEVFSTRWAMRTVSELGDVQLGQQRHPKFRSGPKIRPYLRVANVGDDVLYLDDVLEMDFSTRGAEKFRLEPGDILLNEGQSIELVGRCAMFRGEIDDCYMQKTLLRFRSGPDVLPDFALAWFRWCFHSGRFASVAKRTTSMAHLTGVRFSAMPMPAPPLDEQRDLVIRLRELRRGLAVVSDEAPALTRTQASLSQAIFGGAR